MFAIALGDEVEGAADAGEHAEGKHIDLKHVESVEIVLIPFDVRPILHRRVHDGHHLVEPVERHHEATDVLGEMAREADELPA